MPTSLSWDNIIDSARCLAGRWDPIGIGSLYGVPTGGAPVAALVARWLPVPLVETPLDDTLIVDDLVDSGATLAPYIAAGFKVDALYRKPHSPPKIAPAATTMDDWLVFPWEKDEGQPTDAVIRLIEYIGEDPSRPGLVDTPKRVVKALKEMTAGMHVDPTRHLERVFREDGISYDEMIVVTGIKFVSLCEHHLLPFTGTITIGYVADADVGVVGLSKLPRMALDYARRPQVQERLTRQIAESLMSPPLNARGAGVIVRAQHSCMAARGVGVEGTMTTSTMLGVMYDEPTARSELMSLAGHQ
jgi:GTP cyclohydrolase I